MVAPPVTMATFPVSPSMLVSRGRSCFKHRKATTRRSESQAPYGLPCKLPFPGPDKTKARYGGSKLDGYGQWRDQRVNFAGWMKQFAKRGGNLVIKDVGPQDVDGYAESHELVLVAAGKGEINRMFERDAEM